MHALVHHAGIQDRDGGILVMATLFGLYPFLLKLYADGGYSGDVFQRGAKKAIAKLNIEIVKRSDQAKGFVVLPKRWTPDRVRGRTHHRLAQSLPQAGQRLGVPEPQSPLLHPPRLNQAHAQQAMQSSLNSPDRL